MEGTSEVVDPVLKRLMGYITKPLGHLKQIKHMENRLNDLEGASIVVKSRMASNILSNNEVQSWLDEVEDIKEKVKGISSKNRIERFNMKKRYEASIKASKATERIDFLFKVYLGSIFRTDAPSPSVKLKLLEDVEASDSYQIKGDIVKSPASGSRLSTYFSHEVSEIEPENSNSPVPMKLLLHSNLDLIDFPVTFFDDMPDLQVLDLSSTSIKCLPSSISMLTSLQELFLRNCDLMMELPPEIGALKNLKVFDSEGTQLICLPEQFRSPTKLERLKFSLYNFTDMYKRRICLDLSDLVSLKELCVYVDLYGEWWEDEVKCIINIVSKLPHLESLKLYIPTTKLLSTFLAQQDKEGVPVYQGLLDFSFIVGRLQQRLRSRVPLDLENTFVKLKRCLKYTNGEGDIEVVSKVLKYAKALFIDRHWTIQSLSALGLAEMENLKFCLLAECNELLEIINGTHLDAASPKPVLQSLEFLSIHYMKSLSCIMINRPIHRECLTNLKTLRMQACPELRTIFTQGLLDNLTRLKYLHIEDCEKIESLVSLESYNSTTSFLPNLKKISLLHLPNLVSICNGIRIAPRLESLVVYDCPNLVKLPYMEVSDHFRELRGENEWWDALKWCEPEWTSGQPAHLARVFIPLGDIVDELADDILSDGQIPHYWNVREIPTKSAPSGRYKGVEVVFEIDSLSNTESTTTHQLPLQGFRYLMDFEESGIKRMSHFWKCSNWNEFLIFQKQPPLSSFHNLTTIHMNDCDDIIFLFSPLVAKLLSKLREVKISFCYGIEEVVSSRDDEDDGEMPTFVSTHTITTLFPHLHSLSLQWLRKLKHIGGGGGGGGAKGGGKFSKVDVVSWSLCQYSREIELLQCDSLLIVIPSYAVGQMQKLEMLNIESCNSLKEVFETQGMINNNGNGGSSTPNVDEGNGTTLASPLLKNVNVPQLSHLRSIYIYNCELLEYVFTFSTLGSLTQLENIMIKKCKGMKVIVKQDNGEQTTASSVVVFPRVKSIELASLPNLLGLFLGMNDFEWKSLEKVVISECPQIKVFTSGQSVAPKLNFIHSHFGKYSLDCGLNVPLTTTLPESQNPFQSLESISLYPTITEATPWSYHNLVEIHLAKDYDVRKIIIPSNELLQVKKLEKMNVSFCEMVEEIFEVALEGTDTAVEIPNLREVMLFQLSNLKYIWKNNQGSVLEFPNLTRLYINECNSLKHVFTSSMVGSLLQLQDLHIIDGKNIEVIVKEEQEDERNDIVKHIELPRLNSIAFISLPSFKGFCLGEEAFSFPSLVTLEIKKCPKLKIFTKGHTTTPELKEFDTGFGMCDLREDLNSFVNNILGEGLEL